MKYKLLGLDCLTCRKDLEQSVGDIKGINRVLEDKENFYLYVDSGSSLPDILNSINKKLFKIGHNHKIEAIPEKVVYLKGLNCAHCTAKIENETLKLNGVKEAKFDFATEKFTVFVDRDDNSIFNEVTSIVNRIEPSVEVVKYNEVKENKEINLEKANILEYKEDIFKFIFVFVSMIATYKLNIKPNYKVGIYLFLYFLVGYEVLISAFKNILKGEVFDEKFLMSIASIGAIAISDYAEAVAVMLFYSVGELFEDLALENSRKSISNVLKLQSDFANVYRDSKIQRVSPKDVKLGETILIKSGEKIPLDGIIIDGTTSIDTANMTGESIPRSLGVGEEVISGCVNIDGVIKVKTTKTYENTTVSKIMELVENAQSKKSKTEKFITKFAKIYTPVVVLLALLLALVPPMLNILSFKEALIRACTFLVISCPCAFIISVPLGVFSGIGRASKEAIFIKGGNFLEALSSVSDIVFDKTGTITEGHFNVSDILNYNNLNKEDVLYYAYHGEKNSNHPIALAISSYYNGEDDVEMSGVSEIAGRGMKYSLFNDDILVGNKLLLEENKVSIIEDDFKGQKVYISKNNIHIGTIILKDKIKDKAKETIKSLSDLNINSHMLSGDIKDNVVSVAKEVGIKNYFSDLLPNDKVSIFEKIINKAKGKVVFVGDGVNDAPVIARADIGISMGVLGSDSTTSVADVVLMNDDISKVVDLINISKKTKKIVYENIVFAFIVKITVLILGAMGYVSMWAAVFADVGVTLITVINSTRVLKKHSSI